MAPPAPGSASDAGADLGDAPAVSRPVRPGGIAGLTIGALGVVFGDIGTSPLYTLHECLDSAHGVAATPGAILGVLSIVFWALVMVVAVKYLTFVVRADNHGEGGILALLALIPARLRSSPRGGLGATAILVVAGAALLYGDGMITPAISVLSAVEGLEVVVPACKSAVVPVSCVILGGLFALQHRGTGAVGRWFGPVMVLWFVTLAALGARQIAHHPGVLVALSPFEGARFLRHEGGRGFRVLGSVVLAITGGEALYADLGHFGRRAIRLSWFGLAMPALVIDYFGQGALLLDRPDAIARPFFSLASGGAETYALIALATAATVIASQALISGAFSLTHQAVALGFFPTVTIRHTSGQAEGQIYIPEMNWILAIGCLALVVVFRESSRLAAAYGVAVTGTMVITSLIYYQVTRTTWRWSLIQAVPLLALFLSFDLPFFLASLTKFASGGFVPVLIGLGFFIVMVTWKRGWALYRDTVTAELPSVESLIASAAWKAVMRVPGAGIFVRAEVPGVPAVLCSLVQQVHAVPQSVVLFSLRTLRVPYTRANAVELRALDSGIYDLTLSCGFMQRPDVPAALAATIARHHLPMELPEVTYYLERHTFVAGAAGKMGRWSERLFAFLTRNSPPATDHLGIPWHQVMEIGSEIDL